MATARPHCYRLAASATTLVTFALTAGFCSADGWHNPVLQLPSVNDWLQDAQTAVPDLQDQLRSSTLRAGRGIEDLKKLAKQGGQKKSEPKKGAKRPLRGGRLQAKLTPQQQALLARKANDCLEVLAFMKRDNIYPREFPNFPVEKIPEYRKTAVQLLDIMGPAGHEAIVGRLRQHLMGGFPARFDVTYHPDYVDGMLTVLGNAAAAGELSPEELDSLDQAMQGRKPREVGELVKKIDQTLAKNLSIQALLDWAGKTQDRSRKKQVLAQLRTHLEEASPAELEQALLDTQLNSSTKSLVVNHLRKYLPEQSVPGLLNLMSIKHDDLKKHAESELRKRKPTYAEVKGDIEKLTAFSSSKDEGVAAYADWHLANAFQRAPISHCLYWLGQEDKALNTIIWKQLDARIARADADRKAAYAKTALAALKLDGIDQPTRLACLDLLGRLKERSAVAGLVDQLPHLPREVWPQVGDALQSITGETYGPNEGDGAAEVAVALKRWREWIRVRGG